LATLSAAKTNHTNSMMINSHWIGTKYWRMPACPFAGIYRYLPGRPGVNHSKYLG